MRDASISPLDTSDSFNVNKIFQTMNQLRIFSDRVFDAEFLVGSKDIKKMLMLAHKEVSSYHHKLTDFEKAFRLCTSIYILFKFLISWNSKSNLIELDKFQSTLSAMQEIEDGLYDKMLNYIVQIMNYYVDMEEDLYALGFANILVSVDPEFDFASKGLLVEFREDGVVNSIERVVNNFGEI